MKVLLLRPPQVDLDFLPPTAVGIPLGMLSIAAYLKKKGHVVNVFDALLYPEKTQDPAHFGASFSTITKKVIEFGPDIIGVTNLFSSQMDRALRMTRHLKSVYPRAKIVVGGPHATTKPDDFLVDGSGIDLVAIGEGEITMSNIIDYYSGQKSIDDVKGVVYLRSGKILVNPSEHIPDLDIIPYPAYELVDINRYFKLARCGRGSRYYDIFYEPMNEVTMITSRGCPYECIFCSIHPTMGYKYRPHSPEYVVSHIELLIKRYGVTFIHFEDDNLTLNQPRFEKILDLILEKKLRLKWDTPNGVRADALSYQLLEKAKNAGVKQLRIAIESGNEEFLNKVIKKRLKLENIIETAKNCKRLGIPLSAFYIIGFPGETKENIMETLDLAYDLMKRYNVKPHVNFAMPLVGTEMYQIAKEKGYLVDEDYTKGRMFGMSALKTEHFTPEDLKNFSVAFYKKVRFLYIMQMVLNPIQLFRNISVFLRYPKNTLRMLRLTSKYVKNAV